MRFRFRPRAATRALTLIFGLVLGVAVEAACVAAAQPSPSAAEVYAAALKSGYRPSPPAFLARPVVVTASAARPSAAGPSAVNCLAAAVYYEARGESAEGRAAVAQVVLNRVHAKGWPDSVCAVVYQGVRDGDCQFSFVCNGAMHAPRERSAWLDARRIAARALAGHVVAAVRDATFFHASDGPTPAGAVRLGGHVFHS